MTEFNSSPINPAETEAQIPVLTTEARFIGRVFQATPVAIPDEYTDESKVLFNHVMGLLPKTHRHFIEIDLGLHGRPPRDVPYGELPITHQTAYNAARMTAFQKRLYGNLMELAPVGEGTIARRLLGPTINRASAEQIPNAPFDYSRLSQKARDELSSFGQTSGYRSMTFAFLGIVSDPGLSDSTIKELQREMRNQLQ